MSVGRIGTTCACRATAAGALLILGLAAPAATTALAHEVRFVAAGGDNANSCRRDAPCKTLQHGVNRTPAGGELIVLDSGDYGNDVTIDKSITVSAIGVAVTLGGGISVDATHATVVLRGLRLNGGGSDANGIDITTGETADIYIESCEIQGFHDGIRVSTGAYPMVSIADSVVFNNSNAGLHFQTGTPGRLIVDNSRFEHNGDDGIEVRAAEAAITHSIVSGNGSDGIAVTFDGKANVAWTTAEHNGGAGFESSGEMTLERSISRGNDVGVSVLGSSTARISNMTVTNNGTDLFVESGSTLLTRENNTVGDGSGSFTPLDGV